MLNTVYNLVEPRRIDEEVRTVKNDAGHVLVRPTFLSICNADQRYYRGMRSAEVLAKKLPMALIHEAVGKVVFDPEGELQPGTKVVLVPNTPVESDECIAENYLRTSKFRASGFDGFMQDVVSIRRDRLVQLPEDIDGVVAAFTEMVSVSYHAIDRFEQTSHKRKAKLGVWGDGNLAYVTALLLRYRYPDSDLYVMGKHREKLEKFFFVRETFDIRAIPDNLLLDHAFECVGGEGSGHAINQIIEYIKPEGAIALMGVSENPVPINTRMVLEKGLKLFGSSRSGVVDFKNTVQLYRQHPELVNLMRTMINEVVDVREVKDMHYAFERDISKAGGKIIMKWNV